MKPIIDPSTLTEEQREEIMSAFGATLLLAPNTKLNILMTGVRAAFIWLFGEDFFEKGE